MTVGDGSCLCWASSWVEGRGFEPAEWQNLLCSFARWGLFRLHESPRYLVTNGRQDEAVIVLQAIANFNAADIDIGCADVVMTSPTRPVTSDKKNSELPTPVEGEESPLPQYTPRHSEDSGRPKTLYDSVGVGPAPPPRRAVRYGSAFYASTVGDSPTAERDRGILEEDEGEYARVSTEDGAMDGEAKSIPPLQWTSRSSWMEKPGEWWDRWSDQISKLFVPQWKRTVILMWIIWGSMAFCEHLHATRGSSAAYTMFNVWLPAVLESRASGSGDDAIREALQEFVLYSLAGCPGSMVRTGFSIGLLTSDWCVHGANSFGASQVPRHRHNGHGFIDVRIHRCKGESRRHSQFDADFNGRHRNVCGSM